MATAASAGVVESACLKSERKGVSRALCGCIQQVADLTLTRSDQRLAAKFFKDPQKAQDMRQAKGDRNNEFWSKYKNFGATAEAYCSVAG
jgi:hypothetical protein